MSTSVRTAYGLRLLGWRPHQPAAPAQGQQPPFGLDLLDLGQARPSAPVLPAAPVERGATADPNSYFFNQFRHARWNPTGPASSANCGPASLAMALKSFGIVPPGTDGSNVEDYIDKTRRLMDGTENDRAYTNVHQVEKAARAAGAQAEKVHGIGGVEAALAAGKRVVLAGNPHAYGPRFGSQMSQYNGGHFILVTGRTENGFLINDPLSRIGSVEVTYDELKRYMAYQGWNVGVSVWA